MCSIKRVHEHKPEAWGQVEAGRAEEGMCVVFLQPTPTRQTPGMCFSLATGELRLRCVMSPQTRLLATAVTCNLLGWDSNSS